MGGEAREMSVSVSVKRRGETECAWYEVFTCY